MNRVVFLLNSTDLNPVSESHSEDSQIPGATGQLYLYDDDS